jgi:hypothetical protein
MVEVVNILQMIVEQIPNVIEVKYIEEDEGVYKVCTCNTLHVRKGMKIGNFVVSDFSLNEWFEMSGDSLDLNTKTITLPSFGFHSGTLMDIDGERGSAKQVNQQKSPFVWNREPFRIREDRNKISSLYGTATLDLFFMGDSDPTTFTNTHREEVISPINNYVDYFLDFIESKKNWFGNLTFVDRYERVNVGTEGAKGYTERLFDENLSGVELRFDLVIKKECRTCATQRRTPQVVTFDNTFDITFS